MDLLFNAIIVFAASALGVMFGSLLVQMYDNWRRK